MTAKRGVSARRAVLAALAIQVGALAYGIAATEPPPPWEIPDHRPALDGGWAYVCGVQATDTEPCEAWRDAHQ